VRELRDRARLAEQARLRAFVAVSHLLAQQLERDPSVELGIVGRVDLAHPAAAEQTEDGVSADQGSARQRVARHICNRHGDLFRCLRSRSNGPRKQLLAHCADARVGLNGRERVGQQASLGKVEDVFFRQATHLEPRVPDDAQTKVAVLASPAMSGLAESYLAASRQPNGIPAVQLETMLERAYALGRETWPEIALEGPRFAAHLALCGAPLDDSIDAQRAADLYLACAALEADAAAISALERRCWPVVLRYLRPFRRSKAVVEDVRQELWDSLLITRPGTPPKLVTYSGRGPLAHFVGITAQRLALMQMRRDDARARVADRVAREMSVLTADAELAFIKSNYRGAVREALSGALEVLDDRSRLILRMHLVDGLSFDRIARSYNVSQSTISRWMANARSSIVSGARTRLGERLGVSERDFESLWKLVASQLDISVSRLLH